MPTTEPDDGRDVQLGAIELPPMQVVQPSGERLLALCDRVGVRLLPERGEEFVRSTIRALLGEWTLWSGPELAEAVAVTMAGILLMGRDRG